MLIFSKRQFPYLPTQLDTALDPAYSRAADITVSAGGNVQTAINNATAGQIIELEAGATFTGNFTLPNKAGNGWIYIRSSAYANLPAGTRVGPSDTANMAKLQATNATSLMDTDASAHNFRFIGIEFENTYSATAVCYNIIRLDSGFSDITFDRCYIHGSTTGNTFDGISALDGTNLAVIDSYIAEIHVAQGQEESHGLQLWGITTAKIQNCYVSAAGENILVGDNSAKATNSTDITIRGNYLFKPTDWQNNIASGPNAGLKWKVKNLLELKEGIRVLAEGNLLENCWVHAQSGYGVLFTPRGNSASHVNFRNNWLKNSYNGFQIGAASNALNNVLVKNNVVSGITNRSFDISRGTGGAIGSLGIRHNTMLATGTGTMAYFQGTSPAVAGFEFYDNLGTSGYGLLGDATAAGLATMAAWTDGDYDVNKNVTINLGFTYATNSLFRGWYYPTNNAAVGFVDTAFGSLDDFVLAAGSAYRGAASDGADIGANVAKILAAMND